jgi:MFS family permease
MVWGLFPLLLVSKGFDLHQTGIVVATYPAVWSLSQLYAGKLADKYCKKTLLFLGMFIQGVALIAMTWTNTFSWFIILSSLLGIGTAIVYPTFLAAISDYTHPEQRPKSIGIFRLWRDLGYAVGAILTGLIADSFGLVAPILAIGLLTILSSLIVKFRMSCENKIDKVPTQNIMQSSLKQKRYGNEGFIHFSSLQKTPACSRV